MRLKTITSAGFQYSGRAADLNGDNKPDLVTWEDPGTMKIALGMGDGDFATPVNYSTGGNVLVPDFGDLNGDGRPEMLINNTNGSTLDVWMNNGTGGFSFANSLSHQGYILSVVDLNADGKGDLLSATPRSFSVRFGNGAGIFTTGTGYFPDFGILTMEGVIPGDFDGDGKLDVAVNLILRPGGLPQVNLRLYLKNGRGTMVGDSGNSVGAVELKSAGDFNGDGKDDLVGIPPPRLGRHDHAHCGLRCIHAQFLHRPAKTDFGLGRRF